MTIYHKSNFISVMTELNRSRQICDLEEEYNTYIRVLPIRDEREEQLYWGGYNLIGDKPEISMMTVHEEDNRLPLFCVGLWGGGYGTCYEMECECGAVLGKCPECDEMICSVCDQEH